jgi:hypothetical protein
VEFEINECLGGDDSIEIADNEVAQFEQFAVVVFADNLGENVAAARTCRCEASRPTAG